jgi:hypothetical protein
MFIVIEANDKFLRVKVNSRYIGIEASDWFLRVMINWEFVKE